MDETIKPSELVYWEGHAVTQKGVEKKVGEKSFFVCVCDDGGTYDIPAELFTN